MPTPYTARISKIIRVCVLLFGVTSLFADEEAQPAQYSVYEGAWFAKCFPAPSTGDREAGRTLIYQAGQGSDRLLYTFEWYSPRLYLYTINGNLSLVRIGPWPRGHSATNEDLAFAFYFDGRLLRSYSTLDLVKQPGNVASSVSHYSVLSEIVGYVNLFDRRGDDTVPAVPAIGFEVVLHNGTHLVFDPMTGKQLPADPERVSRKVR